MNNRWDRMSRYGPEPEENANERVGGCWRSARRVEVCFAASLSCSGENDLPRGCSGHTFLHTSPAVLPLPLLLPLPLESTSFTFPCVFVGHIYCCCCCCCWNPSAMTPNCTQLQHHSLLSLFPAYFLATFTACVLVLQTVFILPEGRERSLQKGRPGGPTL